MSIRRLQALSLETLDDLPKKCRKCLFWELDPRVGEEAQQTGDPVFEKEVWVSNVLLLNKTCGTISYVDDKPAGFLYYAPPRFVPAVRRFPSGPVSTDAMLLITGKVRPAYTGQGLGRMMIQSVAKDLTRQGVKAIEAFGVTETGVSNPAKYLGRFLRKHAEVLDSKPTETLPCVIPQGYLEAVGFRVVRDHPQYPRLRLDLKTALSWREDVEVALERILGGVRVPQLTSAAE